MSDTARNYKSGAWGSGGLDAAALAEKYGLDRSSQGRGDGHIWGKNADGSDVYIGKSNMDLASNKTLIGNHSKQANPDEVDHSFDDSPLSSLGDIKGAILVDWKRGAGNPKAPDAPAEETPLSETARKAIAYTKAYEDIFLPRQGDYVIKNDQSVIDDFNSAYDQNNYDLQLGTNKPLTTPEDLQAAENIYDSAQEEAVDFANAYKKAVGDTLVPADRPWEAYR